MDTKAKDYFDEDLTVCMLCGKTPPCNCQLPEKLPMKLEWVQNSICTFAKYHHNNKRLETF